MTANLEQMISNLDNMSDTDLETLQKRISEKLERNKTSANTAEVNNDNSAPLLRVGYRLSSQELKKLLFSFLTPEELAKLDTGEVKGELPTLPKTITEYIDEDREDRI